MPRPFIPAPSIPTSQADMDSYIIVNFRREKTWLECNEEVAAQEGLGRVQPERFVSLGAIPMSHVPDVGKFIFLNGYKYQIMDQTWSAHLTTSEEPNFHDPEVLLTVQVSSDHTNGFAPQEDFRA